MAAVIIPTSLVKDFQESVTALFATSRVSEILNAEQEELPGYLSGNTLERHLAAGRLQKTEGWPSVCVDPNSRDNRLELDLRFSAGEHSVAYLVEFTGQQELLGSLAR